MAACSRFVNMKKQDAPKIAPTTRRRHVWAPRAIDEPLASNYSRRLTAKAIASVASISNKILHARAQPQPARAWRSAAARSMFCAAAASRVLAIVVASPILLCCVTDTSRRVGGACEMRRVFQSGCAPIIVAAVAAESAILKERRLLAVQKTTHRARRQKSAPIHNLQTEKCFKIAAIRCGLLHRNSIKLV